MNVPAAAAAGGLAGITEVTGTISDLASLSLSLGESLSAREGFSYGLCVFPVPIVADQPPSTAASPQPASAAAAARSPTSPAASAAVRPAPRPPAELNRGESFLVVECKGLATTSTARLGLRSVRVGNVVLCVVELRELDGFDTRIGHQASFEFGAESDATGAVLTIKGFVNPFGPGYAHVLGLLRVTAVSDPYTRVQTRPIGDLETVPGRGVFSGSFPSRTDAGFRLVFVTLP